MSRRKNKSSLAKEPITSTSSSSLSSSGQIASVNQQHPPVTDILTIQQPYAERIQPGRPFPRRPTPQRPEAFPAAHRHHLGSLPPPHSSRMDGSTLIFSNQLGGMFVGSGPYSPQQHGFQEPSSPSTSSPLLFQPNLNNVQTPPAQQSQFIGSNTSSHDSYVTGDDHFSTFSGDFLHGENHADMSGVSTVRYIPISTGTPSTASTSGTLSASTSSSNLLWSNVMAPPTPARTSPMYTTIPFTMQGDTMSPTTASESPAPPLYIYDQPNTASSTMISSSSSASAVGMMPGIVGQQIRSPSPDHTSGSAASAAAAVYYTRDNYGAGNANITGGSSSVLATATSAPSTGNTMNYDRGFVAPHYPQNTTSNNNSPGGHSSTNSPDAIYDEGANSVSDRVVSGSLAEGQNKKFQCHICGKYFRRDLPRHLRTHQEVARFVCPYPQDTCPHKRGQFNRPYDFKKHLLHGHFVFDEQKIVRSFRDLHSKLPYMGTCICGMRFSAGDWLSYHVLGGEQQCSLLVRGINDNLQLQNQQQPKGYQ